ncbi:MAG TPA: hypothetical protein VKX49_26270 [Bryobacteraceae bacterium]|nr:hypothetical protein [Bryobacteraceae bacterium]
MRVARNRREKLDGIDHDHISQVIDSRGWQLIRRRIEETRDRKMRELVNPLDPVDTAKLRGEIRGLEVALSVPGILQGEAKEVKGE